MAHHPSRKDCRTRDLRAQIAVAIANGAYRSSMALNPTDLAFPELLTRFGTWPYGISSPTCFSALALFPLKVYSLFSSPLQLLQLTTRYCANALIS